MEYRRLGRSGLYVSSLTLGTMTFGGKGGFSKIGNTDISGAKRQIDMCVDAGVNLIDTADIYTTWTPGNPGGVSEEIIGRWLKSRGHRDDMVIATKVRGPMGERGVEGRGSVHQREGLSRRWIMQACEDSLRRLGVNHIDLDAARAQGRPA